jgi:DNA (cytosine-5)-methyltransferase 1
VSEFVRMLDSIQPEAFLFENVPGFADVPVTGNGGSRPLLHWFVEKCAQAGYAVTWGLVDAADFGTPQHRERLVVMGCRRGCPPSLPEPTHGPRGYRHYVTLRAALRGVDEARYGLGSSEFSEAMKEVLSYVPEGGNWRDLPDWLQAVAMGKALKDRGGKTGFWRRLSWDEPSPTVVERPDQRATCLCHPDETRPLTVRECARLQGFPDWWRVEGPVYARYRQVGDAVPVPLAEALGRALLRHLTAPGEGSRVSPSLALNAVRPGARRRPVGLWGWVAKGVPTYLYRPRVRLGGRP